ncbi:hypothetical protein NKR23_g12355 [Pleurostoma richardsiae]|uniref:DUF7702 domain-containing protein n=1 Tax=Pleurostoma richardsiae TaxID=41990 RepID=A0AA38R617_9PEZI|nr:hypothetical protein NKR23_g12355 [Pleurostoma richardsiae]
MAVSYRTGITILQFIYFVPAGALALLLCFRQGWKSAASSWRFIVTLALLRVAGDIAYFITLSHPTLGAYVTVMICDLMGLAPLTLTCVGLLGRVNEASKILPPRFFNLLSITSLVGLIVGVVGAILAVDDSTGASYSVNGEIQAALALFIAVFAMTLYCFILQCAATARSPARRSALGHETRILAAVGASIPFLLVRLVYAAIADYGSDPAFNFFGGNVTINLCMGVLVEIIVTTICLTAGFLVPPPADQVKQTCSRDASAEVPSA